MLGGLINDLDATGDRCLTSVGILVGIPPYLGDESCVGLFRDVIVSHRNLSWVKTSPSLTYSSTTTILLFYDAANLSCKSRRIHTKDKMAAHRRHHSSASRDDSVVVQ